jgi:GTP pyrophosphokinase
MVSLKEKFSYLPNGEIDITTWLSTTKTTYSLEKTDLIEQACHLAKEASKGLTTFYGRPCIEQGLEMGRIILDLHLDQEAVAAAIMLSSMQHTKLSIDTVTEKLGPNVTKLIRGVQQMDAIRNLQKITNKDSQQLQIDRLRKLLLAMVSDIRVVLIKLAERTCIMRGIKDINPAERKHIAQETMDIYAPLANRLGIGQLKWELEDVSFHYADPVTYKKIASYLAERRSDRENRIHTIVERLKENLKQAGIKAEISGRAKHIYSIYLKTKRKDVNYDNIYDISAIRLLVPEIEDCYAALSIVHSLWEHIPAEFDDYITAPKPNGYRSIHTAVVGPDGKSLEIQIRTHKMHEEAERGVAAHWLYKETKTNAAGYENKIGFLRQLLDWHREVAHDDDARSNSIYEQILEDRVYVFTPAGEILDLPAGATPLDCAYQIHSHVGNHCRGAKINGHIVPLTYHLRTGDQIEILTNPNGTPSRDWLNPEFGYITTARAREKVAHWFRTQDLDQHIESGKRTLEREFSRLNVQINLQKIASQLGFKDEDAFLASVGRGITRVAQISHALETEHEPSKPHVIHLSTKKSTSKSSGMSIAGIDSLLTRVALCCKPIPGDAIIGFITQGRGVSIHKQDCNNVCRLDTKENNRLIAVSWDDKNIGAYYVDVQIKAHGRENLLREVANYLANAKVDLVNLTSTMSQNKNLLIITITIQIRALTQLKDLLAQITHLPGVIEAKRLRG